MPWPQTLLIYIFCKNCVEPIFRSGWGLPSAHAVWGGEGQDHQQVDHGQIITQLQWLSVISAPQIYHYIIPWFCQQSHIHWLLVAKWEMRIQLLILAWWPGRHTTPTPFWWPGCCRHRSRSYFEFYKYFHTTAKTDSDSTVTNSPSFRIGQCVIVWMHWLGCVAVYLSLKTCRDDLFVWLCVVWGHFL